MFYAVEKLWKEKAIQRAKKYCFEEKTRIGGINGIRKITSYPKVRFRLANLSTSLRLKESHRVCLQTTGAFLSYFLPRRLKRELDGVSAGQEEVLYGRSIKCSDAVQAKSNGNS